jgi:ribosome-associated protein
VDSQSLQTREETDLDSAEFARELIDAVADKKGSDIILLDVRSVSLLADYFIIGSGDTERQLKAISGDVLDRGAELGQKPLRVEGSPESGWMVLDFANVIVHIFLPAQRDYYQLEELWSDAPMVVRVQ